VLIYNAKFGLKLDRITLKESGMYHIKEIIDYGVIGLLLIMSILTVALFFERLFYFKKVDIGTFKSKEVLENRLSNNLTTIATIASNAPYIGLLGTVLAIMQTFIIMAQTNMVANKIMESLALALKTTAMGLVVAIVATVLYNILVRKIETKLVEYGS